jgi:hypothetical protein
VLCIQGEQCWFAHGTQTGSLEGEGIVVFAFRKININEQGAINTSLNFNEK